MSPLYRDNWRTMRAKRRKRMMQLDGEGEEGGRDRDGKEPEADTRTAPVTRSIPQLSDKPSKTDFTAQPLPDIPGVVHSIVKCPQCGAYLNLRFSEECYHCNYVHTASH